MLTLCGILMYIRNKVRRASADSLLTQVRSRVAEAQQLPAVVRSRVLDVIASRDFSIELLPAGDLKGVCYPRQRRIVLYEHTPVVLFHELVHLVGGNEFDSEVMEFLAYPESATPPDAFYDKVKFAESGYRGYFCWLDGQVVRCREKQLLQPVQTEKFLRMVYCS